MELLEPMMEAVRSYELKDFFTGLALIPIVYEGYVAKSLFVEELLSEREIQLHKDHRNNLELRRNR